MQNSTRLAAQTAGTDATDLSVAAYGAEGTLRWRPPAALAWSLRQVFWFFQSCMQKYGMLLSARSFRRSTSAVPSATALAPANAALPVLTSYTPQSSLGVK